MEADSGADAIRADDGRAGDNPADGNPAVDPDHRLQVGEHSAAGCAGGALELRPMAGVRDRRLKGDARDGPDQSPEDDSDDRRTADAPVTDVVLPKVWSMVGATALSALLRKEAARRGVRPVWKEMGDEWRSEVVLRRVCSSARH
ncbi:MAG: hypothetical protein MnENMB40S_27510 [Rhizobiaceae bacterium MnEN-MB40S]|nr:MAG: hypothetical protein MnENMB40S_27510 [Rhizobiaceae bacterium MnEN-MB40S]